MCFTGILAPIYLKRAVDALGGIVNQAAVNRTVIALVLSGACRVLNSLAKELQGPCFTPVAQVLSHKLAAYLWNSTSFQSGVVLLLILMCISVKTAGMHVMF